MALFFTNIELKQSDALLSLHPIYIPDLKLPDSCVGFDLSRVQDVYPGSGVEWFGLSHLQDEYPGSEVEQHGYSSPQTFLS